jgi:hypothetical protein
MTDLESDFARIEAAIREASDLPNPADAMREIDVIWGKLYGACSLAESRMRGLVHCVRDPKVAWEPSWLTAAMDRLRGSVSEGLDAPHFLAIESARKLVCALISASRGRAVVAQIQAAPYGCVDIWWDNSPLSLSWIVAPPRLPWPGVDVRVYARRAPDRPCMCAESFHRADAVVKHALMHLL